MERSSDNEDQERLVKNAHLVENILKDSKSHTKAVCEMAFFSTKLLEQLHSGRVDPALYEIASKNCESPVNLDMILLNTVLKSILVVCKSSLGGAAAVHNPEMAGEEVASGEMSQTSQPPVLHAERENDTVSGSFRPSPIPSRAIKMELLDQQSVEIIDDHFETPKTTPLERNENMRRTAHMMSMGGFVENADYSTDPFDDMEDLAVKKRRSYDRSPGSRVTCVCGRQFDTLDDMVMHWRARGNCAKSYIQQQKFDKVIKQQPAKQTRAVNMEKSASPQPSTSQTVQSTFAPSDLPRLAQEIAAENEPSPKEIKRRKTLPFGSMTPQVIRPEKKLSLDSIKTTASAPPTSRKNLTKMAQVLGLKSNDLECPYCEKMQTTTTIDKHVSAEHASTRLQLYGCRECDVWWSYYASAMAHLRNTSCESLCMRSMEEAKKDEDAVFKRPSLIGKKPSTEKGESSAEKKKRDTESSEDSELSSNASPLTTRAKSRSAWRDANLVLTPKIYSQQENNVPASVMTYTGSSLDAKRGMFGKVKQRLMQPDALACPYCPTTAKSHEELTQHQANANHDVKKGPYVCADCGARFKTAAEIRKHLFKDGVDKLTIESPVTAASEDPSMEQ